MAVLYQLSYVGATASIVLWRGWGRTGRQHQMLPSAVPKYRVIPMLRAQSPIKVHEATKEKVRYAALMAGLKQAELVERAVDEYVERHREDFAQRMEQAQRALLGGKSATLA